MPTTHDVQDWEGQTLVGPDGNKIGKIDAIYLDDQTGEPEWALVNTGLFGTRSSFVPIAEARRTDDGVAVPYDKDLVKDAPNVEEDGHLSRDEEAQLFRHYGRDDYESAAPAAGRTGDEHRTTDSGRTGDEHRTTDSGRTDDADAGRSGREQVGRDTSGPSTDDAMTRSEEELHVGTREREAGRVRLRKHVVTENVTKTVPVSHEEVRLEREPITDANRGDALDGPAISEEEHEVVLHAEEPVVDKTVVPKERVRLDKDVVRDETQVSEEVRKERIDTDGDSDTITR